ncbi:hypothetical protein [Actinoplanes sp. HUAS TT8]|uniref:hypothetical protein n=1 Tax=Actinoplanes sp. HUAS TT8 TaxID=3447453 RepID=UPI003F5288E2
MSSGNADGTVMPTWSVMTIMDVVHRRRAWMSRLGWTLIGVALLVVSLWVVVSTMRARTPDEFNRWVGWANVLALVVGALGTALVAFDKAGQRRDHSAPDGSGEVSERCLAELGSAIEQVWSREAVIRQVGPPAPVMVRWSSTGRPAAGRDVVLDEPESPGWRELPMEGDAGQIVAAFRALPHRQLLVLGDPGAGKTVLAMLLTLGLLRHPEPGEPVPVFLSISSWDTGEPIGEFIVRRLAEDFAAVLAGHGEPVTLARRLLGGRRLLPILDGLDELPDDQHGEALDALDRFGAEERPFVVTCRGLDYDRAVRRRQMILSRAAVIEIQPVGVEAAVTFLSYPEPGRQRWQQVFRRMRERPKGHLAAGLSTPLLVALARVAYREPSSLPAELLDLPNRTAVENHLVRAFLTSVYSRPGPAPDGTRPSRAYPLERAERWLTCLAFHLNRTGLRDLRWWQIDPTLLSRHRVRAFFFPLIVVVFGLAAIWGVPVGATQGWWPGARAAATGLVIGVLAVFEVYQAMWPGGYPSFLGRVQRMQQARRGRFVATRRLRLGYGIGGGLLTGLLVTDLRTTIPAGILCGLLAMIVPTLRIPRRLPSNDPALSFLINRRSVAGAVVQHGVTAGAVFAVLAWLVGSTSIGAAAAAGAAVYATTAGLAAGGGMWIQFRLVHARLAWSNWLPWRLGAFLDDAHRSGVLRQAGSVYQFRHALLQDHLATRLRKERLREDAARGDVSSVSKLAELLVDEGAVDEAIDVLRVSCADGNWICRDRMIDLLAAREQVDELRLLADQGIPAAVWHVALHLAGNRQVPEAVALLSSIDVAGPSGHSDSEVERRFAEMLARQGCERELTELADRGNHSAASELAVLLARASRADELRARADGGDTFASWRLVRLLREEGRIDEAIVMLRTRIGRGDLSAVVDLTELFAGQGNWEAVTDLLREAVAGRKFLRSFREAKVVDLLAERGRVDELLMLTEAGSRHASEQVTPLLVARGRVVEAIEMLRAGVKAGRVGAVTALNDLIADPAVVEAAVEVLRASAESGDTEAGRRPEELTADLHESRVMTELLRAQARAGDKSAGYFLAELLVKQGRVTELRARADTGDQAAGDRLAELLMRQGSVDELRARADSGDQAAGERLVELLADRGDLDELRVRADGGDRKAVEPLVDLLVKRGRSDDAIELMWARVDIDVRVRDGDNALPLRLAGLLAEQGHVNDAARILQALADRNDFEATRQLADLKAIQSAIDVLSPYAEDGNADADEQLAELLAAHGRVRELGQRADSGGRHASVRLAELLAGQDRIVELRRRADANDYSAERLLVDLLVTKNDDQALREWAETGNGSALCGLVALHTEQGRLDQAIRVVRSAGDGAGRREAARSLAGLLADRHRVDEAIDVLQTFTDARDRSASRALVELLTGQGRLDDAIRVVGQVLDLEYAALEPVPDVEPDREGPAAESNPDVEFGGEWLDLDGEVREWERRMCDLSVERGRLDIVRAAADAGDSYARRRLAAQLALLGHIDELRTRADTGDPAATEELIVVLHRQGDIEQAIERLPAWVTNRRLNSASARFDLTLFYSSASTSIHETKIALMDLLAKQDRVDDLAVLAAAGDSDAERRFAALLARLGRTDVLQELSDAGDSYAAGLLIETHAREDRLPEIVTILRAGAGGRFSRASLRRAGRKVADSLTGQGRTEDAQEILQALPAPEIMVARPRRAAEAAEAKKAAERGDINELRALADAGRPGADWRLAGLLVRLGRVEELRERAGAGDWEAASRLAQLLVERVS